MLQENLGSVKHSNLVTLYREKIDESVDGEPSITDGTSVALFYCVPTITPHTVPLPEKAL